jgi:hypothetical protein
MTQVDRRLTKVNLFDRIIRVNKPGWKLGASQLYILSSLEQNEWSGSTNENNYQNKFICHPEQQMWCQSMGQIDVIIIDRTSLYVISNKKCQNKWEQLLEPNSIIVGTILCVISNKNKCIVRTNQNKGSNKILIAITTYYSNDNKFTSHLKQ